MTNINKILMEKQKPIELVQELKKTNWWEKYDKKTSHLSKSAQGLVNRKSGSDYVSEDKEGYGPMPIGEYWWQEGERTGCGVYAQIRTRRFCLNVECYNWLGSGGNKYVYSTSEALWCAHELEDGTWHQVNDKVSDEVMRKCATLVREAVRHYDDGNEIDGYVRVQGKFWGGYEWSRSY